MARPVTSMQVVRSELLSPNMIRVVLGGAGFQNYVAVPYTDSYIKIIFSPVGVKYPEPLDIDAIKKDYPADQQPILRTYTVRYVDAARQEIAIDFVIHGTAGIAGPWAKNVQPGTTVHFHGPNGAYAPDPAAPWHLFACDESGLPAVSAALEKLPKDAVGQAFIEVNDETAELKLTVPAGVEVNWIHRGGSSFELEPENSGDNAPLVQAVRSAPWLAGEPQVFIHGEASVVMHNLRRYIRKDRGISAAQASISGYWRHGRTEEGFRKWKSDLKQAEEANSTTVS